MKHVLQIFFSPIKEKVFRTPEEIGFILLILYIYRIAYNSSFLLLYAKIIKLIGNYDILFDTLLFITQMLFISSKIYVIVTMIMIFMYIIVEKIIHREKHHSEKIWSLSIEIKSFITGCHIGMDKVFSWLIVIYALLCMCDNSFICKLFYRINANKPYIYFVFESFYVMFLIIYFIRLLRNMFYRFFYFHSEISSLVVESESKN